MIRCAVKDLPEYAKTWTPILLSTIALLVSIQSCRTSSTTFRETFAPKIAVSNVELIPPQTAGPQTNIRVTFKIQNIGQSRATEIRDGYYAIGNLSKVAEKEVAYSPNLEPGDPSESIFALNFPSVASERDFVEGRDPVELAFVVTASSMSEQNHRSCFPYIYDANRQTFEKAFGCTPIQLDLSLKNMAK